MSNHVFVNCPFDDKYLPLLKALLFSLIRIGYEPRLALERSNSAEVRLDKIKQLIEESDFGIHDLSRSKSKTVGEYYRLNMPFELGLDLGFRDYANRKSSKPILILEEERYSTQKALSDLSFADCKCHKGQAEEMVYEVRDWFADIHDPKKTIGPAQLWNEYNEFNSFLLTTLHDSGYNAKTVKRLRIPEFMQYAKEFIAGR